MTHLDSSKNFIAYLIQLDACAINYVKQNIN